MTAPESSVLFLTGAGLPAWIWDDVRADLSPYADTTVARYPRDPQASLADYAEAAAAQAPAPTFALVAHSSGGVVAAELMARRPERVTGVLGVAAVVPRPGRSFLGSLPLPARLVLGAVLRVAGTRPSAGAIRAGLAGGLPAATVDRLVAEFEPESVRHYRDACSAYQPPAARGYLSTGQDRELSAAVQRRSAAVLGARWTEELATGHLPMLEDAAGTSWVVRRLLAEVSGGEEGPAGRGTPR